jgi:23S rRNA (cytosine1962-C5)-methyltransferase
MDILSLLRRARESRDSLFGDPLTDCFRLFHAGKDGLDGLTIDLYGNYLLVQIFYGEVWDRWPLLRGALDSWIPDLGIPVRGVLLKDRRRPENPHDPNLHESRLVAGEMPPAGFAVLQGGAKCIVDLVKGQNTGLFLDMREVREKMIPFYPGISYLLNLFCYTGMFSVHALLGGATGATNVDLSRPVLARAKANYAANGFAYDDRDFICGDSFKWMRAFQKKDRRFSLVIFDPPTFSRNKGASFSVKRNYPDYLRSLAGIAEGGYALTAMNADFLPQADYLRFHPRSWENVFLAHESLDFRPGTRPYLKAGLWRVSGGDSVKSS